MKLIPVSQRNPGNWQKVKKEQVAGDIKFKIHKFSVRRRPPVKNIVIFPIFSEFGSETLIPLLCLPSLLRRKYAGRYIVVVGWFGRSFLYQHLVDEFWELDESHQDLREYCRAFHHDSKRLKKLENALSEFGKVIDIQEIAGVTVYPVVKECPVKINDYTCKGQVISLDESQLCTKCGVRFSPIGAFYNMQAAKKSVVWLPDPCKEKIELAKQVILPNSVGIVGRSRKCYGRNLDINFYQRLVSLIQDLGYNVVWMGEKGVSLKSPSSTVFDWTSFEHANDFEMSLAAVKQMKFTIQFWTASTRLAGYVGTPFMLFESPDQIWGGGHEGYRLNVCSKGPKKIVVAHFKRVVENQTKALNVVKEAVFDIEQGHFQPIVGLVDSEKVVRELITSNNLRVGF